MFLEYIIELKLRRPTMPYLVAGAETVYGTFHKYTKDKNSWGYQYLKNFMSKRDPGYLFSFGNGLATSKSKTRIKIKGKYSKTFGKFFTKDNFIETNQEFNIDNIVMDSGGYQAQSGYLTIEECYEFIDEYKKFIELNHESFRYFFALDLIPDGLSYDELVKLNTTSFETLNSLPENIRKKIIFIYHFFTPKVHQAWQGIADKYFNRFSDFFSFGGLAAKDTVGMKLPIAVFSIGIVKIVANAIKHNMNNIKIHILGAASYRDVMLYQLYKAIIKEYHDINIDITYDSSLVFKQIQKSRCINIIEDDFTNNLLSIREAHLEKFVSRVTPDMIDKSATVGYILKEKFLNMTKEISPEHFDIVNNVNIYEMKTDGSGMALSKDFGLLSILFSSYQYNELEKKCYAFIMEKMQLLKDNPFEFYNIINDILLKLNAGKLSYKFKDKVKYISATVECLIKLDGEYIDEIVDVFLAGAEIVDTVDTIDTMPIIDF
jgi:hypothetical protein